MSQLFSNNAESTLAASLSDVATSATVADGSPFRAPTGGDFELLTLLAAGVYEIVKVTARTTNTLTIVRAQEGTTARNWVSGTRIFAGVTAGSLSDAVNSGIDNGSTGIYSLALGESSTANDYSTALGAQTQANGLYGVAAGWLAISNADYGISAGVNSWSGLESVAVGGIANAMQRGVAIGQDAYADDDCVAIGHGAVSGAGHTISIGKDAEIHPSRFYTMAFGQTYAERDKTIQIGALPVVPKNVLSGVDGDAIWQSVGAHSVVMTAAKDLKTAATYTLTLPTGVVFFPDEVGVVITAASGVTGQPTVRFGITGTETKYLAATATTGLEAVRNRQRFTALASDDGATTLRAEVTVAATGTTLTGRLYWRGTGMSNP